MYKCPDCREEMKYQDTLADDGLGVYDRCWCEDCKTVWCIYDTPSEAAAANLALLQEAYSDNEELFSISRDE